MLHRIAIAVALCLLPPARAGLEIWDTGTTSAQPLTPAAIDAKAGWTKVAETGSIKGDAVLSNGRLTVVVRRNGTADLYSPAAARARLLLQGANGDAVARLDKIVVAENAKGAIAVEIAGSAS